MCKTLLNIGTRDKDLDLPEFKGSDALIRAVYAGTINPANLPESLYNYTLGVLVTQLEGEFGLPSDFPKRSVKFRRSLAAKRNLSIFSGAKTFQHVTTLSVSVFDSVGNILPFGDFANIALSINNQYNLNFLRTEQNTAFRQSQAIESWADIQDDKEIFPLLRYSTVGDGRVRDEHAEIDDPFFDNWFPPNGFNCRCIVEKISEGKITKTKFAKNPESNFDSNVGKNGLIFQKTHPYNTVPAEFQKAKDNNFGFTVPTDKDVREFLK